RTTRRPISTRWPRASRKSRGCSPNPMSASNELYQQVILDHNRNPRNYRPLPEATHACHGHNPLCGDDITVFAKVGGDGKTIEDVSFQGNGCAICKASASLM